MGSTLLLTVILTTSLYAQDSRPQGGTLVLSDFSETDNLNTILVQDTYAVHLGALIFNSLIKFNEKYEAVPDLAESWQVSAGGLVWDFKIKKGVLFHNGKELTAADAAFTYNSIINPRVNSPHALLYDMVKSFKAAGRYVFRVELNEPYSPLIFIMDQHILPAHLLEQSETAMYDFGKNPVGSGPFEFSEWKNGEIILLANDHYFEGRPNLDRVILKSFASRLSAWSALMQGKVDVVSDLDFEDFRIIKDDPRFKTYDYLSFFYYTILFNLEDSLFADKDLRRALDLAIDRGDIVEKALKGCGIPTTGPFRPGTWTYNNNVTSQRYNPKEAARLLKELGWQDSDGDRILDKEGEKLYFTLLVDKGDSLKEQAAKRIRWQLFLQGIEVKVEFLEPADLFEKQLFPGNFQAVLLQFNIGIGPDRRISFFWHSNSMGRSNLARYSNREVDRLIERGRIEADLRVRKQIYHNIHELIAGDRPALFLFFRRKFLGVSAKFNGIKASEQVFYHSIREWYIEE